MVKKYLIAVFIGILIGSVASGFITHRRAEHAYSQLESGYLALEESNRILRESNTELIANNQRFTEIISGNEKTLRRGQDIIREFQAGIGDSKDTIERIEKGIEALERLIGVILPADQEPE